MGERIVMPSVRSREVACAQRSRVGHRSAEIEWLERTHELARIVGMRRFRAQSGRWDRMEGLERGFGWEPNGGLAPDRHAWHQRPVPQIVPPTGCYCAPLSDTSVSCAQEGIRGKYKQ